MLLALDVAILPPADIWQTAIALSASLPAKDFQGLRLGPDMLPHITLTQQFVNAAELDAALESVGAVLRGREPLTLSVSGGGRGRSAVWMTVEHTPELADLHATLMDVLQPFEQPAGTAAAFFGGDARPGDVAWVSGFRRESSYSAFTPHITLGHAPAPPDVAPVTFAAATVAVCRLGRFCTCRQILRKWT